ncbi:DeoR/GlpR family DNA-binding transcription regulator [Limibacillus halophilus]|jgi:DeoR family glycerol-3-phosphate regulon repressor
MSNRRGHLTPKLRRARILALVREQGQVSVEDLAEAFDASHETIRRDLSQLAEAGSLQKVHGGAKLPRRRDEGPFHERLTSNEAAKRTIAGLAARLLSPGETLFIDTGSTTLLCAEEASEIDALTVVTNSTRIAAVLAEGRGGARVFLLGGEYDGDNAETTGSLAISQIRGFHADHAILGVGAVDARSGAMDISFEEAEIARAMIESADEVIVLADSSKLDRSAAYQVCPLSRINHLVCERAPKAPLAKALAEAAVTVHFWQDPREAKRRGEKTGNQSIAGVS